MSKYDDVNLEVATRYLNSMAFKLGNNRKISRRRVNALITAGRIKARKRPGSKAYSVDREALIQFAAIPRKTGYRLTPETEEQKLKRKFKRLCKINPDLEWESWSKGLKPKRKKKIEEIPEY